MPAPRGPRARRPSVALARLAALAADDERVLMAGAIKNQLGHLVLSEKRRPGRVDVDPSSTVAAGPRSAD